MRKKTQPWTVRHLRVTTAGENSSGVISWFVHTDGGVPETIIPATERCLRRLGLAYTEIRRCKVPFAYVITFAQAQPGNFRRALEELLGNEDMTGAYCDDAWQLSMIIDHRLARIADITRCE